MLALILVAASVGVSNLAASIGIGAGGVTMATRVRVLLTFGVFEAAMPIIGLLIGHDLASDIGREARLVGALLLGGVGGYGIVRFVLLRVRSRDRPGQAPSAEPDGTAGAPAAGSPAVGVPAAGSPAAGVPAVGVPAAVVPEVAVRDAGAGAGQTAESGGPASEDGGSPAGSWRSADDADARDRGSQHRMHQWVKIGVSAFALSLDNLIAGFALGSYQMNLITGALVFGIVSIGMSLAGLELGAKLGTWAGDGGELIGGVVLVGVGVAIGTGVLG